MKHRFLLAFISFSLSTVYAQNMGVKLPDGTTPNTTLDVNGSVAFREGTALTLTNGVNSNVTLGDFSLFRLTGPTAAFSITGFTGGQNGRVLTLINTTSYTLSFTHQITSTSSNQIITGGASVDLAASGVANLVYNTTLSKWVLISTNGSTPNFANAPIGSNGDSILVVNSGVPGRVPPGSYIETYAWGLDGNAGTTAGTNYLGTTDAQALVFKTNNAEQMRLSTAGSLGIGVSPLSTARLHVENTGTNHALYAPIGTNYNHIAGRTAFGRATTNPSVTFQGSAADALWHFQDSVTTIGPNIGEGIGIKIRLAPSAAAPVGVFYGLNARVHTPAYNSQPIGAVQAANLDFRHYGSGTISTSYGAIIRSVNLGTGRILKSQALNLDIGNYSGTIDSMWGVIIASGQFGATTNAGVGIGVHIADIPATTGYGIWQGGENDKNYFAGNVGIGNISPQYKLDVDAASSGNPLRLLGLQAGTTSDSILSVSSGIVRRLAISQIAGSGSGIWINGSGTNSAMLPNSNNNASGNRSVVSGYNNSASGQYSGVFGGTGNQASGENAVIVGGSNNTTSSLNSVVLGGTGNQITGGQYSVLLGGQNLVVSGSNVMGFNGNNTTVNLSQANMFHLGDMDVWLGNTTNTARELRFYEPNTSGSYTSTNYTAFKAQSQSNDITYTLPTTAGSNGQVLTTNGSGSLSWTSASGSGWGLTGNSGTTAGTNFIGTTDGQALSFRANNTEWMRISTAGNVGLGLTSPSVKMHQDGGTGIATVHKFTANTTTGQTATDGFDVGIDGSANAVLNQREALPMILSTSNTERMRVSASGNVGIGQAAPSDKLEVRDGNLLLSNSGTAGELRLAEPSASGTNYTAFKTQAQAANVTYTLPAADGTSGQVLSTNGAGALSWTAGSGAGAGAVKVSRKTANESVTSSTTMQSDDHLFLSLGANETWEIYIQIEARGNSNNYKMQFTAPTGATLNVLSYQIESNNINDFMTAYNTSTTSNYQMQVMNSTGIFVRGIVTTGATAGNFQLQWAQVNSDVVATQLRTGSYIKATRLQ